MNKTPLTAAQIEDLVAYDNNMQLRTSHIQPAFDKVATLSIIDAVTDHKLLTDDGLYRINYYTKAGHDSELFFVRPVAQFLPCGNFEVDSVISRLAL